MSKNLNSPQEKSPKTRNANETARHKRNKRSRNKSSRKSCKLARSRALTCLPPNPKRSLFKNSQQQSRLRARLQKVFQVQVATSSRRQKDTRHSCRRFRSRSTATASNKHLEVSARIRVRQSSHRQASRNRLSPVSRKSLRPS